MHYRTMKYILFKYIYFEVLKSETKKICHKFLRCVYMPQTFDPKQKR